MTEANWRIDDHETFVEVLPIADKKMHLLGDECWCEPNILKDEDMQKPMISHNALDGRE